MPSKRERWWERRDDCYSRRKEASTGSKENGILIRIAVKRSLEPLKQGDRKSGQLFVQDRHD
jgi:hypothetical protein